MDKTISVNTYPVDVYRKFEVDCNKQFSDSSLSDDIHNNIRTLSFFHPLAPALIEHFENGMFVRSNTRAFPHVMKYLFTIIDVREFKKNFGWPLYNKAAEASFRNSSLEMLNKLNAKYKLKFGELKNKIVVFPGGSEFMRILLELTKLAMKITLKSNGTDPLTVRDTWTTNEMAETKLKEIRMLYDHMVDYTEKLAEQTVDLKTKTERIGKCIENLTDGTDIMVNDIVQHEFCEQWQETQHHILENGIRPNIQRIEAFRAVCERLDSKMCAMVKKQPCKYDENMYGQFIDGMRKLYPLHFHQQSTNLSNVLLAFQLSLPLMCNDIQSYQPPSAETLSFESKEVEKITLQLNANVLKFAATITQKYTHPSERTKARAQQNAADDTHSPPERTHKWTHSKFKNFGSENIFTTPPIALNAYKRREKPHRISTCQIAVNNKCARPIGSKKMIELSEVNHRALGSVARSHSMHRMSSIQMLRTIEHNSKFGQPLKRITNVEPTKLNYRNSKDCYVSTSDINTMPSIASTKADENDTKRISIVLLPINQLSPDRFALQQDDGEHFRTDIKMSPSGRLRVLSKVTNIIETTKSTATDTGFNKSGKSITKMVNHSNIENDLNVNNTEMWNLLNVFNKNEELLLDVSESILDNL